MVTASSEHSIASDDMSASAAQRFIAYINASPTPFHAVRNGVARLESAGFRKLLETDASWDEALSQGGRFYLTRNQSSLVAFTVPTAYSPGHAGLSIVGTHTDSPNLRIRPVSNKSGNGYLQVAVELYGGGLWHTWFDRDLGVAGRVILSSGSEGNLGYSSKLVHINKPILRIPNLAIHLNRGTADNLKFNTETEMIPVLGLVEEQLNSPGDSKKPKKAAIPTVLDKHHPKLVALLAEELAVSPEQIEDFELSLFDVNPSTIGGINDEFIFSARLDNLMSTFCAIEALCGSVSEEHLTRVEEARQGQVNVIACFNHEEVGSVSSTGAEGSLLKMLFERLAPGPGATNACIAKSLLLSADMAHAVHPASPYAAKHQELHRPSMNKGVVLKTNANQRYATEAIGAFLVRKMASIGYAGATGRAMQEFETRNDVPCGSTIGAMISKLGIRTVDIGTPMLSMHSCREQAGTADVDAYLDLFGTFFEKFRGLDQSLTLD